MAVGAAAAAEAGRSLPLRAAGLALGSTLGAIANTAGSLAANSTRGVAALARDAVRIVPTQIEGAQAGNEAAVVLGTGGRGVTRVGLLGADVVAESRSRAGADATHASAGCQVAGRGLRRAGGKRAQVGKTLCRAQVVGDAGTVRATRKLKCGSVAAGDVGVVVAHGTGVTVGGKVKRGSSAQAALVHIETVGRGAVDVGSRRGLLALEDGKLSGLSLTDRLMFQSHVVGENVNGASVLGGNAGREDENLAGVVAAEHDKLSVEIKRLGIVQVDIT